MLAIEDLGEALLLEHDCAWVLEGVRETAFSIRLQGRRLIHLHLTHSVDQGELGDGQLGE